MFKEKLFKLRYIVALSFLLSVYPSYSQDELDFSFVRQFDNIDPSLFDLDDSKLPTKTEYLKIFLNGKLVWDDLIKLKVVDDGVCLDENWPYSSDIAINYSLLSNYFDESNECYLINKIDYSSVSYKPNFQSLSISLPSIYISDTERSVNYDFGRSGFRVHYNLNTHKSSHSDINSYLSLKPQLNVGKWILYSDLYGRTGEGFSHNNTMLYRALPQIGSEFYIGELYARPEHSSSFAFKGFSIGTDKSFRSWKDNIYAPRLSGVASSNALVTVSQDNRVLAEFSVPPGPFVFEDYVPMGNGEIVLEIKEDDGSVKKNRFPVTLLPNVQRTGISNYLFSVGEKQGSIADQLFLNLNYNLGLDDITVSSGSILSPKYSSVSLGVAKPMTDYGTISASTNVSYADFSDIGWQGGVSFSLNYAKRLNQITDMQLIGYHYEHENYIDFSNYEVGHSSNNRYNRKQRYEFIVNNKFDNFTLRGTGWRQEYWNDRREKGADISLSSRFDRLSYNINFRIQDNTYGYERYVGLNLSLPLGNRSFLSNNFYYRPNSKSFSNNLNYTSVAADNFNYGLSVASTDYNSHTYTARAASNNKYVNIGASISKSDDYYSTSVNGSGAVFGLFEEKKVVFSSNVSPTSGIINVDNIENVTTNRSSLATDSRGLSAVTLSPYRENRISINTSQVEEEIDMLNYSIDVVPTKGSIQYFDYKYTKVNRYLFKLIGSDGKEFEFGTKIYNNRSEMISFVASDGLVHIHTFSDDVDGHYSVFVDDNTCHFNVNNVTPNVFDKELEYVTCYE